MAYNPRSITLNILFNAFVYFNFKFLSIAHNLNYRYVFRIILEKIVK